jgi:hypothetical protein
LYVGDVNLIAGGLLAVYGHVYCRERDKDVWNILPGIMILGLCWCRLSGGSCPVPYPICALLGRTESDIIKDYAH